jgi:hypothetical protein
MPAVPIGLVCLAVLAAAGCSLSLDGDHFRGDPDTGAAARFDASAPDPSGDGDGPDPDPPGGDDTDPDACGETCPGGNCDLACPERACDCELDCAATFDTCKAKCERHHCTIDCRQVDRCEAVCKDSRCTIDCTGARECDHVKCEEDSGCLLDCTGTDRCGFDACDGEVTSCPGDKLACNRACP